MSAAAPSGRHRDPGIGQRRRHRRGPTPSRPCTATRTGAASAPDDRRQPRIAALLSESRQRVDENLAASCPLAAHHGQWPRSPPTMLAPLRACRERLLWLLGVNRQLAGDPYQSKATVGYQSVPRCGYSSLDERPWTDAFGYTRMSVAPPALASASPGHQLQNPPHRAERRPAGDLGSALAGGGHARPRRRRPRPAAGHRGVVRAQRPVVLEIGCGAGTSTLAMAQAEPELDVVAVEVYRRGLAQLLVRHRPRRRAPMSAWSAATASTSSSTCSDRTR